jgi:hypothetical protein
MNANGGYFEPMQPKRDFLILGCIALERIIQKCNPKAIFGILGCMSYQMILGTMHPKGKFLY